MSQNTAEAFALHYPELQHRIDALLAAVEGQVPADDHTGAVSLLFFGSRRDVAPAMATMTAIGHDLIDALIESARAAQHQAAGEFIPALVHASVPSLYHALLLGIWVGSQGKAAFPDPKT